MSHEVCNMNCAGPAHLPACLLTRVDPEQQGINLTQQHVESFAAIEKAIDDLTEVPDTSDWGGASSIRKGLERYLKEALAAWNDSLHYSPGRKAIFRCDYADDGHENCERYTTSQERIPIPERDAHVCDNCNERMANWSAR